MLTFTIEMRATIAVDVVAENKNAALAQWMEFDEQALGSEFGPREFPRWTVSFDDGEPDVTAVDGKDAA